MNGLICKLATARTRRVNESLRREVRTLRASLEARDIELDELAAVVARNRARVELEHALWSLPHREKENN